MTDKSIFSKIIDREIPAEIVHEDDMCIVIKDLYPKTPIHLLIIPKKPIISLAHIKTAEDAIILAHMMQQLNHLAESLGVAGHYKTMINTGSGGGQEVFHLHIHFMADPSKIL